MPIGRPFSPVSVAGVARRNDRRDGPGNDHTVAKAAVVAGPGNPVAKAAVVTGGAGPAVKMAAIRR